VTEIRLAVESRGEAGCIATVTVDNPAKLNILGAAGIAVLERTLDGLAADDALRAVILRGAGSRAFIGGADIRAMVALDRESARAFIAALHRACRAIRRLPVPVLRASRATRSAPGSRSPPPAICASRPTPPNSACPR